MADRTDQPDTLRLMQRRKGHQSFDGIEHIVGNRLGAGKPVATMGDAMPDAGKRAHREMALQPTERFVDYLMQIIRHGRFQRNVFRRECFSDVKRQGLVAQIDHPASDAARSVRLDCKLAELDSRGARVESQQNVAVHGVGNPDFRRLDASLASATDASRTFCESERLVRTIGTRAPSTRPAASAPAR